MTGSNLWSDGNALAGSLQSVLGVEVTAAVGRCAGCGRTILQLPEPDET